eukprot:2664339-Pyramimonas_sp.AAC.1
MEGGEIEIVRHHSAAEQELVDGLHGVRELPVVDSVPLLDSVTRDVTPAPGRSACVSTGLPLLPA